MSFTTRSLRTCLGIISFNPVRQFACPSRRFLSSSIPALNSKDSASTSTPTLSSSTSSLFGDLDPTFKTNDQKVQIRDKREPEEDFDVDENAINYIEPESDEKLQKYLSQKPYKTVNALLSPLKRRLYLKNIQDNGFYKNNETISLADGKTFRLNLSREEIQALEPSIYLRSWRIKSSVKKTNIVLRAIKDLPLKKAITQLQFMEKKVSRELTEMLMRSLEDAKKMEYDVNKLYIAESWVHTDGSWQKRLECKGRGRVGIITHRWVSVRILLKTDQTLKRLAFEKQQRADNRKVVNKLDKERIRGISPGFYKW